MQQYSIDADGKDWERRREGAALFRVGGGFLLGGRNMERETVVLCGANSYEQKYYFNRDFAKLPEGIQQELQVMCVLFTEDVGGVLTLEFSPEGVLEFKVQVDEQDYLFDEIGSELKIREYQREKRELLEALEMFYRVFFMGIDVGEVERMNLDKMGMDE